MQEIRLAICLICFHCSVLLFLAICISQQHSDHSSEQIKGMFYVLHSELFCLVKGSWEWWVFCNQFSSINSALRLRGPLLMDSKWYFAMVFYCPGVFVGMLTMGQMPTRWCGENLTGRHLDCSCLVDAWSVMKISSSLIQKVCAYERFTE